MLIRAGYEISFSCEYPTHLLALLSLHPSRHHDLVTPHRVLSSPDVPIYDYPDLFGNVRSRLTLPAGESTLKCDFTVQDSGLPDPVLPETPRIPVEQLPDDVLLYLSGSRYCETDRLSDMAWAMFGDIGHGWHRVQAIVNFTHDHISFGYNHARATRSAWDTYQERVGVDRDFAHLAITLCRCMNIPARFCTGYLAETGGAAAGRGAAGDWPMDFTAWIEVYLDGGWYVFDPRHNAPRIGRIAMAKALDGAHTPLTTSFGNAVLTKFVVHAAEDEGGS